MLFAERLAVSAVTNIGVGSLRFVMSNIMMSKNIWKAKSEYFVFFSLFKNTVWQTSSLSSFILH